MFVVTEADTAAICAVFEQEGELSAAIEVRRLFRGVTDNTTARAHARSIAGREALPVPRLPVTLLHPGQERLERSQPRDIPASQEPGGATVIQKMWVRIRRRF